MNPGPDNSTAPVLAPEVGEEIRSEVARLVEAVEVDVLAAGRRILLLLGLPVTVLALGAALLQGKASGSLVAEILSLLFMSASVVWPGGSWPHLRHRGRTIGVTAGLTSAAVTAAFQYGLTSGVGLFYVSATISAAFFHGRRGTIAVVAVSLLSLVLLPVAVFQGWASPELRLADAGAWARVGSTTGIVLAWVAYFLYRVRGALYSSVEAQVAAARAERLTVAERERMLGAGYAAQRLEGLGRLAGGVAHKLNNALVVIQAGVDAARSTTAEAERLEHLAEVDLGIQSATATTRPLLAFTRGRVDEPRRSSPAAVIDELQRALVPLFPEETTLQLEVSTTPDVAVEASVLEMVLFNLAVNAREAMPTGGIVRLSAELDPVRMEVVLGVSDTGVGIPTEIRDRIFEPFFSTKGELGPGLGLALVWGVVRQHNGVVEVESEVGRGTLVRLRFPALPALAALPALVALPANEAPPPAAIPAARPRILLVEDEEAVRRLMVRMLVRSGAEVVQAGSVAEAADALGVVPASFALLVTDGLLPDGTAADVIRAYRRLHPESPIIVASGHLENEEILAGVARGDLRFLGKPFGAAALTDLAAELLAAHSDRSERPVV